MENSIAIYGLYDETGVIKYVGKTVRLLHRFRLHLDEKDWVVGIKVLEWVSESDWVAKEKEWIKRLWGNGLVNIRNGGEGVRKCTLETRIKLAIAYALRPPHSAETRAKISAGNKGKTRTEEQRRRQSEWRIANYTMSDETRQKISAAKKGKPSPRKGCKMTPEQVEANRQGQLHRKPITDETRKKLSEAGKGRIAWSKGKTLSDDTKRKIAESCKSVEKTAEWNKNNSNGVKKWYATMTPEQRAEQTRKIVEGQRRSKAAKQELMKQQITSSEDKDCGIV